MADIKINPIAERSFIQNPAADVLNAGNTQRSQVTAAGSESPAKVHADKELQKASERPELEDVIAVSKDGDTVQASETSKERLEEDAFGHVEVKQDNTETGVRTEEALEQSAQTAAEGTESQQAIKEAIQNMVVDGTRTEEAIEESTERAVTGTDRTEEAIELGNERAAEEEEEEDYIQETQTEKHEDQIATYTGISDMRLEQMYLQGEISQNDYNREMEAREEEREAEQADDGNFSTQMTGAAALEESGERDLDQIENVFSDDANDNIAATDRMQIIQSLDAAAAAMNGDGAGGEESAKRVVIRA